MHRITTGRSRRRLGALGAAFALTLLAGGAHAIDYTSVNAGDWAVSTNWSPVGVPGGADTVTINHPMTTVSFVQVGNVTINSGGSLSTGSTFATTGDLTLNGTGTATFPGPVTFNGSGLQTITGAPAFNSSLFIANSAATPSDAACVRSLSAITVAGLTIVNDGQFSPGDGSAFRDIQIDGGGVLRPASGAEIRLTGASSGLAFNNNGTFSANSGTVAFTGSIKQRIQTGVALAFNNVRVANTAATPDSTNDVQLNSSLVTVQGTLTVADGLATWNGQVGSVDLQANGLLELNNNLSVSGNWTKAAAGTFTPAGRSVTFNGTGAQAITGATDFAGLTISNTAPAPSDSAAVTASAPVTSSSQLTVNDGQFMPANGSAFRNISINLAGILKPVSGAEFAITGASSGFAFINNGSFVANSGTVAYTGSGGQQIAATVPTVFHNIRVANTAATPDASNDVEHFASTTNLSMTGTLDIEDGQASWKGQVGGVDLGADGILALTAQLDVSGDWTKAAAGTFTPSGLAVNFNGTAAQTISGNTDFLSLTITNSAATPSDGAAVVASGVVNSTGQLTINDGQFMPADGNAFRNISLNAAGILKPVAGAEVLVTGDTSGVAFFNVAGSFVANSSTFAFTGSAEQRISSTVPAAFHNIRVANTAAVPSDAADVQLNSSGVSVGGTLTVEDGQATWRDQVANVDIQANGLLSLANPLSVSGNWSKAAAATFTPAGFQVTFNGAGAQAISGDNTFGPLAIANTAAAPSDSAAVVVSGVVNSTGQLTINDGQFMPANGSAFRDIAINAAGILKPASGAEIAITGNNGSTFGFFNNGGSLVANGGTVAFTGSVGQQLGATVPTVFHNIRVANTAASPDSTNDVEHFASAANLSLTGTLDVEDGLATWKGQVGGVDLGADGILALNGQLNVSGDWTKAAAGTFTPSGLGVTFNGSGAQAITGATDFAFLTISNTAATPSDSSAVTASAPVTSSGQLLLNDGQFMPVNGSAFRDISILSAGILKPAAGAEIAITGNSGTFGFFNNGGTLVANGSTVAFTGSVGQQLGVTVPTVFHNIRVANTAASPDSTTDVEHFASAVNLSMTGTLDIEDGQASWKGQVGGVDLGADGILALNGQLNVSGDWTKAAAGTFTTSGQTVSFNGDAAQSISGAATTFTTLLISNSAVAPSDSVAVTASTPVFSTGQLVLNDGQFMPANGSAFRDIAINAAGILKPAAGVEIAVTGSGGSFAFFNNSGTLVANGGTVAFTGNVGQMVGALVPTAFHNIRVANTAATPDSTSDVEHNASTTNLSMTGDLVIEDGLATWKGQVGSVELGADGLLTLGSNINVAGDWTHVAGGVFTPGISSVNFNGSGLQTVTGPSVFSNLVVTNTAATPSDAAAVVTANAITATGQVTLQDGQFTPSNGSLFRNMLINAAGILKPAAGADIGFTDAVGGIALQVNSGTLTHNGGQLSFLGNAEQRILSNVATVLNDVYVFNSAPVPDATSDVELVSNSVSMEGDLTVVDGRADWRGQVRNVEILANGILTNSGNFIFVSGDWTKDPAGLFTPGAFAISFNGTGAQAIIGSNTFGGLSINNSAATPSDSAAVIPDSAVTAFSLTVSDGQFMPPSGSDFNIVNVNVNGILKPAAAAALTVSGAFTVNGAFVHNGGQVTFDGNSGQDVNVVPGNPFGRLTVANTNPAPNPSQDVAFLQGITVEGDFEVTDGLATFAAGSGTHAFGQDFTIWGDGLVDHEATSLDVDGDWLQLVGGSFTPNGNTVAFSGNGPQTISGTTAFGPLVIANTAATPSDAAAVIPAAAISADSLSVNDGQFNIPSGSNFGWVDIDTNGIVKAPSAGTFGILGANGGVAFDNAGTFDANGSTALFYATVPQAVTGTATFSEVRTDGPNASAAAGIAVADFFTIDGGLATGWRDLNNVFLDTSGTWDAGSDSVTVSGNLITDGVLDADAASFLFDGTGVQALETSGTLAFGDMTVAATSTVNEIGPVDLVTVVGTLTNSGTLRRTQVVTGPGTITGGLTGATVEFTASGTVTDLVIDRIDSVPNATADHIEPRSWTITPTGAGYTASITLPHALPIASQATVSRYLGTGTDWDFVQDAFTANTVTRDGVTDLSSRWAVANRVGTAVPDWTVLED